MRSVVQAAAGRAAVLRLSVAVLPVLVAALLVFAAPALAFPPTAEEQSWPLAEGLDPLRADALAFASDGELWFAGSGLEVDRAGPFPTYGKSIGVIGHVSATGDVVEIPIGHSRKSVPGSIAAGPDGAMWFTIPDADSIGRAALDGTLTEFPLPPGRRPGTIVAGPDGNLWFTEPGVGEIGRMATNGRLDEFAVGPESAPSGIAVGPDGNLWFTLTHSSRIGRLTPSGERAVFRLPKRTYPRAIVATGAGLWFSERSRSTAKRPRSTRIGLLTVAGRLRQITVPARTEVTSLAAGTDGTVWYTTARTPAAIGSISPGGEKARLVCVVSIECLAPAVAIAVAPDGKPWFSTGEPECGLCGGGAGLALQYYPGDVGYLLPM